jgi:hypothetical protein
MHSRQNFRLEYMESLLASYSILCFSVFRYFVFVVVGSPRGQFHLQGYAHAAAALTVTDMSRVAII